MKRCRNIDAAGALDTKNPRKPRIIQDAGVSPGCTRADTTTYLHGQRTGPQVKAIFKDLVNRAPTWTVHSRRTGACESRAELHRDLVRETCRPNCWLHVSPRGRTQKEIFPEHFGSSARQKAVYAAILRLQRSSKGAPANQTRENSSDNPTLGLKSHAFKTWERLFHSAHRISEQRFAKLCDKHDGSMLFREDLQLSPHLRISGTTITLTMTRKYCSSSGSRQKLDQPHIAKNSQIIVDRSLIENVRIRERVSEEDCVIVVKATVCEGQRRQVINALLRYRRSSVAVRNHEAVVIVAYICPTPHPSWFRWVW